MNRIKILSKAVYSKIAAGEVIDRPASAVRELADNSIDALASEIIINIIRGGLDKIIVTDNGAGIQKEDLELAVSMHATSKIENIEDLQNLMTMGFRGEALYSIQAVSKLTITTNTDESGTKPGCMISNSGPDQNKVKMTGCKKGTKVEVSDIFYNLPVRKKFLKSVTAEFNAVKSAAALKALSNLNTAFRLYNNNSLVFSTKGDGDFKDAFFSIYKNEPLFSINHYIKEFQNEVKLAIYYSNIDVFFPARKYQMLFVNSRPVAVSFFYSAASSGMSEFISPGRHPLLYVYLEINPELIDVNIHPAKKEIRFYDQSLAFNIIQNAVRESFASSLNRDIFKQKNDETQTGVIDKNEVHIFKDEKDYSLNYFNEVINVESELNDKTKLKDKDYNILGTAFDTYIVVERKDRILFIDQHAACEAIIYRQKKENYKKSSDSEKLVIPIVIDLEAWSGKIEEKITLLNNNNFEIERSEGQSILIRALPGVLLDKKDYDAIVEIIKDFLADEIKTDNDDIVNEILIQMSCREAVKKGDKLTLLEIAEIIDQYIALSIVNCPHGRPSHFEISREFLDKAFQRKK